MERNNKVTADTRDVTISNIRLKVSNVTDDMEMTIENLTGLRMMLKDIIDDYDSSPDIDPFHANRIIRLNALATSFKGIEKTLQEDVEKIYKAFSV